VNYDEMDGDRLRLPANRNCYRLSRILWALLKLLVTKSDNVATCLVTVRLYSLLDRFWMVSIGWWSWCWF